MLSHIQIVLQSKIAVWPQQDKAAYQGIQSSFHYKTSSAVKLQTLTAGKGLDLSAFVSRAPFQ
jgi:hypothetical protein